MGISKTKEQVRDGFLGDLPEELQTKVMNIHKLIKDTVNDFIENDNYQDLKSSSWAMSCINDFCVMPKDKSEIGSVRVYKKGKTYKCMIQATGHFRNHQYGWIEELLHDFICNVYSTVRPKVRKKYDITITNEGRTGQPFEGFDIYPNPKAVPEIWEKFEGRKTKAVTESSEEVIVESTKDITKCNIKKLPKGLVSQIDEISAEIKSVFNEIIKDEKYHDFTDRHEDVKDINDWLIGKLNPGVVGSTWIENNETLFGEIVIVPEPTHALCEMDTSSEGLRAQDALNSALHNVEKKVAPKFNKENPDKKLKLSGQKNKQYFVIELRGEYAKKLIGHIENPKSNPMTEAAEPEYNVDMTELEAKRVLRTLSQGIINDIGGNKKDYKVSQYTANIYANIITKNLLPLWSKGYKKISINLDSYQSFFTFEFKTPNMSQDFVSRFVAGRESIGGFLHRQPEIKIKMSPRIFHTMKNPDDAYNFFKAAIRYYDAALERYSSKLMVEVMKLNHDMKHLISTTKMSGIVTLPMSLLFVFDDVKMDNKDTFRITQDDIKTINSFIHNIYTKYASPEKEKKKIVEDVKEVVKAMREACGNDNENIRQLSYLPEAVEMYLFEGFTDEISKSNRNWIYEQLDTDWSNRPKNSEIAYLQESFGVKKLKKIPTDLVAYITIETESIKDSNDKMMISSYCLGKIEIVEWYIELLEVGSKKYIVPHTKPYLETVRTQLLACFKKIMDTPIPKKDRPLINIQYPQGYEG